MLIYLHLCVNLLTYSSFHPGEQASALG